MAEYIQARLQEECRTYGRASEIARATGFSSAHISNAKNHIRHIGADFADALASYWGMTYDELQRTAAEWSAKYGRPKAPDLKDARRFRDRPEWPEALAGARQLFRAIPEEYLEQAGNFVDLIPYRIDAQFVGDFARSLWEVALRDTPESPTSAAVPTSSPESSKRRTKNG